MSNELSNNTVKSLRITAISLGVLMLLAAGFANVTGISTGDGFSRNQIGFLAGGLAFIIAGVLGRKFIKSYKQVALMTFNLIVAVVFLEFACLVLVKLIDNDKFAIRSQKMESGHLELVERSVVAGMYAPFVVWRSNPALNCDTVRVNEAGYRYTPGCSTEPDSYKVFLFGGSAMWGTNVADSGTIGAYLQQSLSESFQRPVAVSNLAQVAHSSTQEIIELMLQLRSGNVPDFVVFYDGFNDVWGAYEAGKPGTHHSENSIAARVEGRPEALNIQPPFESILKQSNTWLLITSIKEKTTDPEAEIERIETYYSMGVNSDSLSAGVVSTYLGNCAIVEALAAQYGFEYLFVWQPSVWYGEKTLSEYEEEIVEGGFPFFLAGGDPAFKTLYTSTYLLYEETAVDSVHYLTFARIFDDETETIYNDYSGVHVNPLSNEMIADDHLDEIRKLDPMDFKDNF